MVGRLTSENIDVSGIEDNQTKELFKLYLAKFSKNDNAVQTLEGVLLMTPENIHLNSFMYEPILDMSDGHLRKLYIEVQTLQLG
jgi:hypothetical protein